MESKQRPCYKCEEKMITTPEQEKELDKIWRKLQNMLPDMHGSIRFNLTPGRTIPNYNVEYSKIGKDKNNEED